MSTASHFKNLYSPVDSGEEIQQAIESSPLGLATLALTCLCLALSLFAFGVLFRSWFGYLSALLFERCGMFCLGLAGHQDIEDIYQEVEVDANEADTNKHPTKPSGPEQKPSAASFPSSAPACAGGENEADPTAPEDSEIVFKPQNSSSPARESIAGSNQNPLAALGSETAGGLDSTVSMDSTVKIKI